MVSGIQSGDGDSMTHSYCYTCHSQTGRFRRQVEHGPFEYWSSFTLAPVWGGGSRNCLAGEATEFATLPSLTNASSIGRHAETLRRSAWLIARTHRLVFVEKATTTAARCPLILSISDILIIGFIHAGSTNRGRSVSALLNETKLSSTLCLFTILSIRRLVPGHHCY